MAMGGTAVLPFAIGAGAIVGASAGIGYAGYKAVKYFEKKKKVMRAKCLNINCYM